MATAPYLTITKLYPEYKDFGIVLKDSDMRYINEQIVDGDEYRIDYYTFGEEVSLSVFRRDYTSDNENEDYGIKETLITSYTGFSNPASVTFVVEQPDNVYNFEYMLNVRSIGPRPTPTPTMTITPTNTMTPTPTMTPTVTPGYCSIFGLISEYIPPTPTPTNSATPTITPTNTSTPTPTNTPTVTSSVTPTSTNTPTVTSTNTPTPTRTVAPSRTPAPTKTRTPTPTSSVTPTPTITPTSSVTPTVTPTITPTSSITPTPTPSLGHCFYIGSGFNNTSSKIIEQSDGKLLITGTFTSYNGTDANRIIRLNSDGSIDTGFTYGTGFDYSILSVIQQSDGKLLIGGSFNTYNGTSSYAFIRLNSDGTVNTSFTSLDGFNGSVNKIIEQSDGKLLIGGAFTTYSGITSNRIVRLNSDLTIDSTFSYGTGFNGDIKEIAIQSDGKILIGGIFTTYKGTSANRIIRLNSDGSIDTGFTYGTGFGPAYGTSIGNILQQSDGKILIIGSFTSYNGTSSNGFIRLNSDGTVNTSFTSSTGFNNSIYEIFEQTDGKILIGGIFTAYNGTNANRIIRLNSDLTIDSTFSYGSGFDSGVNNIKQQSNGKIFILGSFTSYNGITANRIVRINSNGSINNCI